jgi:hypothetical protein
MKKITIFPVFFLSLLFAQIYYVGKITPDDFKILTKNSYTVYYSEDFLDYPNLKHWNFNSKYSECSGNETTYTWWFITCISEDYCELYETQLTLTDEQIITITEHE